MSGRVEIQDYGDKVVFKDLEGKETIVDLKVAVPKNDTIEATEVIHINDGNKSGPSLAFVGTDCGVFVIDTTNGVQKSHLLGNKRVVRCFKLVKKTLYVGVKDYTTPVSENFGLWKIDVTNIEAHPVKKVADWEVSAMVTNSKETQMAATYCQNINGSYWFEVHLFSIHEDELTYQTRIGEDGWGNVEFKEDDKSILIDKSEYPIPAEYLGAPNVLGKRKIVEGGGKKEEDGAGIEKKCKKK